MANGSPMQRPSSPPPRQPAPMPAPSGPMPQGMPIPQGPMQPPAGPAPSALSSLAPEQAQILQIVLSDPMLLQAIAEALSGIGGGGAPPPMLDQQLFGGR